MQCKMVILSSGKIAQIVTGPLLRGKRRLEKTSGRYSAGHVGCVLRIGTCGFEWSHLNSFSLI